MQKNNIELLYRLTAREFNHFFQAQNDFDWKNPNYIMKSYFKKEMWKVVLITFYLSFFRKRNNIKIPSIVIAGRYHSMYLSKARQLYPHYGSMLNKHRPVHRFSCYLRERFPDMDGKKLYEFHQLTREHNEKEIPQVSLQPIIIFVSVITAITQAFSKQISHLLEMSSTDFESTAFNLSLLAFVILAIVLAFKFLLNRLAKERLDRHLFKDSVYLYLTFLDEKK